VSNVFSSVALKYQQAHKAIPVLVVDNANKLPESILQQFQDYAKEAADKRIATIVFVLSEGRVPRHMKGTSILYSSLIVMLIKCYSEKLMVKETEGLRNRRREQR